MPAAHHTSAHARRRLFVGFAAVLLFVTIFLYRFNTLGGAFGGLDNDHFLYFGLAKQVEAGEQPLRDFQDAMHGAWPSLTYEFSAAAQRYFGSGLRSEAFLTVAGVALGASVAFVAGTMVAPWPWALAMALLSGLVAPKLYGYPKVLVTAVAALIIVSTRGSLNWRRIGMMGVWTAIAFLFRHDYAVYCAVGFTAVIALSPDVAMRARMQRFVVYGLLTLALLLPSLAWVQHYRGLVEYVRNARELSRNEYERTRIGWPQFSFQGLSSTIVGSDENAEAWLYYLYVLVPAMVIVVGVLAIRDVRLKPDTTERLKPDTTEQLKPDTTERLKPDTTESLTRSERSVGLQAERSVRLQAERSVRLQADVFSRHDVSAAAHAPALIALSLMTIVLWHFFLRGNLAGRVGDMAPPFAVLSAYLLGIATMWRRPMASFIASSALAMTVLAVTVLGIWQLASVGAEMRTARLLNPFEAADRFRRASEELANMPRLLREGEPSAQWGAAAYLHQCTQPTDRVMAIGYYPDVPASSERLFAGGRLTFVVGYYADPRYARETIAKLDSQPVPIVLGGPEMDDPRLGLTEYLHSRYDEVGTVANHESRLRVLVRRGLKGSTWGPDGLPCFG